VPNIISERCELVKLCHINRSGPVFYNTVYISCHIIIIIIIIIQINIE